MPDPKIPLAQHEADARLATAGPWRRGSRWLWARTHAPINPESPTCAYCKMGPPQSVRPWPDDDHKDAMLHGHIDPDPEPDDHRVETEDGKAVTGNYDYECGGVIRREDRDHIANCDPQTMAAFYRVVRAAAVIAGRPYQTVANREDIGSQRILTRKEDRDELSDALEAFEL